MDNTVVTASDMNYFWGVLMLVASMRCHDMHEPVIVCGVEYSSEAKDILQQFPDVRIVDVPRGRLSLTCQKPNAMLLAETKFVTWADCDAFFHGNCSKLLTPQDENLIHIRRRSLTENKMVYPQSPTGAIPDEILDIWQTDVGERTEARFNTCCSACFMSLATRQRPFLERWRDQMTQVLPKGDIGVVDRRSKAYFQTDESVLNSLLCFLKEAPEVTADYQLNKNQEALFIHFVAHPKPWHGWSAYGFPHFDRYVAVAEYLLDNRFKLPDGRIPYSLLRKNKFLCRLLIKPLLIRHKLKRLKAKLSQR